MKIKTNLIIASVILFTVFESCKKPAQKDTDLLLIGQVINNKSKTVSFRQVGTNKIYTDSLDDNGNFSIKINNIEEAYFFVGKKENSFVYLMPGDTTEFLIDEEKYDSLMNVKGDFSEINNYLIASENIGISNAYRFSLSDSALKISLDSIAIEKRKLFNKNNFAVEFTSKEKLRLYSDSVDNIITRKMFEGIPKEEVLFLKELDVNNYIDLPVYFSNSILNSLTQMIVDSNETEIYPNAMTLTYEYLKEINYLIIEEVKIAKYRDRFLKKTMSYFIEEIEIDSNFKKVSEYVINSISDVKIKKELEEKYQNRLRISKGSIHPTITFKNTKGDIVNTTDSIFKDKLIYIDVWATWCPPCVGETPSFIELSKKYKGKDIVFVGISFDNERSYDKWMPYVNNHDLLRYSIQGIAQNEIKKKFDDNYLISDIPRFILIDKKGNIIDVDAPRPSDKEKIIELINNHL